MIHYREMVDDCIALLSYVSKHRNEWQTIQGLAEKCGIPRLNLRMIIIDADMNKTESLLWGVAVRYGFLYRILHRVGSIIDVVYEGCLYDIYQNRL